MSKPDAHYTVSIQITKTNPEYFETNQYKDATHYPRTVEKISEGSVRDANLNSAITRATKFADLSRIDQSLSF